MERRSIIVIDVRTTGRVRMLSDSYKGLDDLRVNPFITPQKQLMARATFKCPACGETVGMDFTGDDIKALWKGYQEGLRRGPP